MMPSKKSLIPSTKLSLQSARMLENSVVTPSRYMISGALSRRFAVQRVIQRKPFEPVSSTHSSSVLPFLSLTCILDCTSMSSELTTS